MASQGLLSADSVKPTGAQTPADALGESKRMPTENAESQESYECPTCGRGDFESEMGMKTHHARTHGESISGEPAQCDWCGDTFRRDLCELKGKENVFCDLECKAEWESKNIRGESHPLTNRVHETCHHCGSELSLTPHQKQTSDRNYCDRECMMAWRRENGHLAKEDNPNWDGGNHVTVKCSVCGDDCDRRRDEVEQNITGNHFCSTECRGEWQSENWVGEDHPTWKGGKLNRNEYGLGWTQQKRESVRDRDDHRCQACGISQQEHTEQFGSKLDVHHIMPARSFDDAKERNAMSNLVTLCRSCHKKWEGVPLRPQLSN